MKEKLTNFVINSGYFKLRIDNANSESLLFFVSPKHFINHGALTVFTVNNGKGDLPAYDLFYIKVYKMNLDKFKVNTEVFKSLLSNRHLTDLISITFTENILVFKSGEDVLESVVLETISVKECNR